MRSVKLYILYTLKYIFSIVIYLAEIVAAMLKHFVIHLNSFFQWCTWGHGMICKSCRVLPAGLSDVKQVFASDAHKIAAYVDLDSV